MPLPPLKIAAIGLQSTIAPSGKIMSPPFLKPCCPCEDNLASHLDMTKKREAALVGIHVFGILVVLFLPKFQRISTVPFHLGECG